jgi:type IV pilus assembly protein PilA
MAPYKLAVEEGFQAGFTLDSMDAATDGGAATNLPITPAATANKAFNSLAIANGVITATPNAYKGIVATETCVLTPTADGNRLIWNYSGGCVTLGYVKN